MSRATAAMAASGVLVAGAVTTAGPALAEEQPPGDGGVAATLDGPAVTGEAVVHEDGEERRVPAGLFEMSVDNGGSLQTYSVDLDDPAQRQARYKESDWDSSSLHGNRDAGRIRWILQHSYPRVNDLRALAKKAGVKRLTPQAAAVGTQVAVWRFSDDGVNVSAVDPAAEKLADRLESAAGKSAEPKASLSVDRIAVAARSGDRTGPLTVHTSASEVAVAPATGIRAVGKDGKPVTVAHNGSELWLSTPGEGGAGTGEVTLQASTKIPVGRALTGAGAHSRTHVVAGSSQTTVSARTTVNWADSGAIPATTVRENCAGGGVGVTVTNAGDAPYRLELDGREHVVRAGATETVTVPVEEDQPYRIPVRTPMGPGKTFTGVLDCETASATAVETRARGGQGVAPQGAHTAAVGGADAGGEDGTDLAETGSSSNTGLIIGIAVALVLLGTVALLAVRRGGPETGNGSEEKKAGAGEDAERTAPPGTSPEEDGAPPAGSGT